MKKTGQVAISFGPVDIDRSTIEALEATARLAINASPAAHGGHVAPYFQRTYNQDGTFRDDGLLFDATVHYPREYNSQQAFEQESKQVAHSLWAVAPAHIQKAEFTFSLDDPATAKDRWTLTVCR